jgi:hypothetical protein
MPGSPAPGKAQPYDPAPEIAPRPDCGSDLKHKRSRSADLAASEAVRKSYTMTNPQCSDSIVIAGSPEELYDMVSDVTQMGKWSPVCTGGWWDEGASARVGGRFTGRNELGDRTWETLCEVVAADRGREFAFVVGDAWTRWGYTFEPVDGGTKMTESWEFLPGGAAMFDERFGADASAQIANRAELARTGISETLAAIKREAEGR